MNKNRKLGLQVFTAPENMTGVAQIQVRAREIDFVTSFGQNMQALLDVMGIARMIRKENGSVLRVREASGVLQSGDVAEGDIVPLSQYEVTEKDFDTIKIQKYKKGVSIEAIAEKGYEAAVAMTDEEFTADLQNVVMTKFYDMLKMGSLTSHETSWQMAFAMAIGRVKNKFETMGRTATGIAVWVNTLDVYKYLGAAQITMQTAFGVNYVRNFMGADIMFISSQIPENTVIATPLNNIVAYYVDPSAPEFARAGLVYTTDPATGFIGFNVQGNYDRVISELNAIMGVRLFAEYLDAIAYISVGSSSTQTLGTLTVTSEEGSETGATKITVNPQLASINGVYKYKTNASGATAVTYGMDVKTWTRWDGVSEIETTNGHHVTVVEADENFKAVRSGDVVAVVKS